jgi:hypothetical protein
LFAEYWGCDFGCEILWLSKETGSCDFGCEKNQMDVVKYGGITRIHTNQGREKDLV